MIILASALVNNRRRPVLGAGTAGALGTSSHILLMGIMLVLVSGGASGQGRQPRFDNMGNFFDSFQDEIRDRLSSNMETAMGRLRDFSSNFGSFSDRLESQVQQSLPPWLRDEAPNRRRSPILSVEDAPLEAVIGKLGPDGPEDSYEVYFDGDSAREKLPEPHIIPSWSIDNNNRRSDDKITTEEGEGVAVTVETPGKDGEFSSSDGGDAIPPPRTGGPLFDLRFNFGDRFPLFPRLPGFGGGQMPFLFGGGPQPKPWWKGENVCIAETELDEPVREVTTPIFGRPEETFEPTTPKPYDQKNAVNTTLPPAPPRLRRSTRISNFDMSFGTHGSEMKSCQADGETYVCTIRTSLRGVNKALRQEYRCCHGFVRDPKTGCTKVHMVPLAESLEDLGLKDFLTLVKNAGAIDMLKNKNLTVFAPSNEAVQDYTDDLTERNDLDITDNEVFRRKRSSIAGSKDMKTVVHVHMYEGFLYAGDMEDEQVIRSVTNDSSIRINVYRKQQPPLVTLNCARMVTANQHSSNGIIHTIDRVMQPATRSIWDIVSTDSQFSILKKLLTAANMTQLLRDPGQLTLLAPTDAAFSLLPPGELDALLDASICLPAVLQNHILPNVICTAAITQPVSKTGNLLEKYLHVRIYDNGQLFVEDAQVVAKDIMGTNGVIHILDAPLMPHEAKPLPEVLKKLNMTRFLELLEIADLMQEMRNMKDVTVFAPSNDAFDDLKDGYLDELKADRQRLREVLLYHISTKPIARGEFFNDHLTETMSGDTLRLNLYRAPSLLSYLAPSMMRMRVTAGCGTLSGDKETRACGATVHIVDTLLEPAKDNVLGVLERDPNFSIFSKIAKESSMATQLSGDGPLTVMAPSDHVFKTLPQEELERVFSDKDYQEDLVQRHIFKRNICCSGIPTDTFPYVYYDRSVSGVQMPIHRTPEGLLKAGSVRITNCSRPSRNGLVHTVNSLFVEPHIVEKKQPEIDRWDSPAVPSFSLALPDLTRLFGAGRL